MYICVNVFNLYLIIEDWLNKKYNLKFMLYYCLLVFGQTMGSIHEIYLDTFVKTLGEFFCPQNFPNDVIPICVCIHMYAGFSIWIGPPASIWKKCSHKLLREFVKILTSKSSQLNFYFTRVFSAFWWTACTHHAVFFYPTRQRIYSRIQVTGIAFIRRNNV